jgi:FKBP-type peptidyl-prolyl cis-trans isomerase SlyD
MAIQEGDFIKLTYTGTIDGDIFDTTDEDKAKDEGIFDDQKSYDPITIRVGSMHVIPGLDEAVVGKEVGDEDDVEIAPEKGYGPRDDSLIKSTSVKEFKEKPTIGMRVQSEGREGVVVNVIGKRAVIDFNHPFAGKVLDYHFRIEGIVEDAEEKANALIKLFSGRDMDVNLDDGILTIDLPPGINYDRKWIMGRGMIVHQIFEFLDEVKEVIQKETFKRPQKTEEPIIEPQEDISQEEEREETSQE